MTVDAPPRAGNPYVGPASFRLGDPLYGRNRERQELLDLLIAQRIVLLYSPSGAGKTSLIQAALVPELRDSGFRVLPIIRVTHALEASSGTAAPRNRYVLATLLSLEEGLPQERQRPLADLAALTLAGYLDSYRADEEAPVEDVLVFDQFEEILTADPTDDAAKHEFFRQLGEALRDRNHWALFSMREDFLAALDPYLRHVPTRFRSTYRLDLLTVPEALEAMRSPARQAGVEFTEQAAEQLADDLRQVRVQRPGGRIEEALGSAIEPVQLQVACRLLWSALPPGAERITPADVDALGRVDQALGDYYADRVRSAAERTGVREAAIRDWFETCLITPQDLRGQVLAGPATGAAGEALLAELVDAHLVRAETRRHATWYELAHDRLIEPVRRDNAAWRGVHLSPFERSAMLWEDEGRPDRMLLLGSDLAAAEHDPAVASGTLKPREQEFLHASRRAEAQRIRERRSNRLMRIAVALVTALALLAGFFLVQSRRAQGRVHLEATESELLTEAWRARDTDQGHAVTLAMAAAARFGRDPLDAKTRTVLDELAVASPVTRALHGRGPAWAAQGSADGRYVVTAGAGGLQLWDRTTGAPRRALRVRDATKITNVDISQAGNTVVAGFSDGAVLAWDVRSGRTKRWASDDGFLWNIHLSPDGSRLVTIGLGNRAQVWDVRGTLLFAVADPDPAVTVLFDAAFSPDGRTLVTVGDGPAAVLWSAAEGVETGQVPLAPAGAASVVVSTDGQRLGTLASDGTTSVIDIRSGDVLHTVPGLQGSDYARTLSPDLSRLLTVYAYGLASVADLATGGQIAETYVPGAQLTAGGFDARDTSQVLVLSRNADPAFWQTRPVSGRATVDAVATAHPTSGAETFVAWSDGTLARLDGVRGQQPITTAAGSPAYQLSADRSGTRLATTDYDGGLRIWDVRTGALLRSISPPEGGYFWDATFTPDGTRLVTGDTAGRVVSWDPATGQELRVLRTSDFIVSHVDVSPDGSQVLATDQLRSESLDAGQPVAWLISLTGAHRDLALRLPPRTPRPEFVFPETASAITFSPDGSRVLVGTSEGRLAAFDSRTGKPVGPPSAFHEGFPVVAVTAGPDGRVLTTGSDQRVVLSDASGRTIRQVAAGTELVDATLAPDGRQLVIVASSGPVNQVPLDDAALVRTVGSKVVRALSAAECRGYGSIPGC